jgi:hypothetical protein
VAKKLKVLVVLIISVIGIGYSQQSEKVTVFPNPATNVINVLGLKNSNITTISITNIYGKEELKFSWEIKNNALNIPITNLEQGVYHITIYSEEQFIQKKFYKQ